MRGGIGWKEKMFTLWPPGYGDVVDKGVAIWDDNGRHLPLPAVLHGLFCSLFEFGCTGPGTTLLRECRILESPCCGKICSPWGCGERLKGLVTPDDLSFRRCMISRARRLISLSTFPIIHLSVPVLTILILPRLHGQRSVHVAVA